VTHAKHAGYASPGCSEFPFFAGKASRVDSTKKREKEKKKEREGEKDQYYVLDRCVAMRIASAWFILSF